MPNCKLSTLAGLFGAPPGPQHRALADARATATVLMSTQVTSVSKKEQITFADGVGDFRDYGGRHPTLRRDQYS